MSQQPPASAAAPDKQPLAQQRIDELEMRIAFLEDTIDSLNDQVSTLSQEFLLAKQAMQLMHRKLEQLQQNPSAGEAMADEPPPPHY
ncbi:MULTISPECIES: SlyX family protein [Oceanospirillaceae]|jgi:SlyX protein|uniref:SlyX family protein n=1 Tax=Oceanospirillaceae TaxID=135620 RepID=UPI0011964CD6|nr:MULTISPECIES: SlyX family protein [Thalassolituus]MBU2038078.1 SlyX family protein [Gammaproteobacteria bacterium]MCA6059376.1 SlyX family protein [Thalassolituus sp. ST750PaO-4]MCB2386147.1 SlyX family protein [Thalassolituus alkanivorans]MCB2422843.1 SlyX family protein [Thalassolituus alkanivorans]TVV43067.1 SlyX family protein [Thalassolituus sp. C2-1]